MEAESKRFYIRAARSRPTRPFVSFSATLRLKNGATRPRRNSSKPRYVTPDIAKEEHESERRLFLMQIVQPGLAVSWTDRSRPWLLSSPPRLRRKDSWQTLLVGLAAAIGAGISMGFAEALSDNGSLTGRGSPWLRGGICGLMTTLGGLGHALPYLIPNFWTATTIAAAVVLVELAIIAGIRNATWTRRLFSAAFQVVVGGLLVFGVGVAIGSREAQERLRRGRLLLIDGHKPVCQRLHEGDDRILFRVGEAKVANAALVHVDGRFPVQASMSSPRQHRGARSGAGRRVYCRNARSPSGS